MMCKGVSIALALGILMRVVSMAGGAANTSSLLVVYACEDEPSRSKAMSVLTRQIVYANRDVYYKSADEELELDSYSGIIVYVDPGVEMNAEAAKAIWASGKPILIIGQGGVDSVVARWQRVYLEGDAAVRLETVPGVYDDILIRARGMTILDGERIAGSADVFIDSKAYPLCQKRGRTTHMAYFDADTPSLCALLATLTAQWLWPYQSPMTNYGHYLVLDKVYPFEDTVKLMEITSMLEDLGVPYALSLMPIYANAEYPSMMRFCEYLRYIQSRGAGLILHAPLVSLNQSDPEQIKEHIAIAYEAYVNYGVYPLAIQASQDYLMSEKGLSVLTGCRTVFLYEAGFDVPLDFPARNHAYSDGHYVIAPAYTDEAAYTGAYAQAIYLDINDGTDDLRRQVERLRNSSRTFKNLTGIDNALYIGSNAVITNVNGLEVNGVVDTLAYVPFKYDEDFQYDRGFITYMMNEIQTSNRFILAFVLSACAVFIYMIYLSRRELRRELVRGHYKRKLRKRYEDEQARDDAQPHTADKQARDDAQPHTADKEVNRE